MFFSSSTTRIVCLLMLATCSGFPDVLGALSVGPTPFHSKLYLIYHMCRRCIRQRFLLSTPAGALPALTASLASLTELSTLSLTSLPAQPLLHGFGVYGDRCGRHGAVGSRIARHDHACASRQVVQRPADSLPDRRLVVGLDSRGAAL